jgi:1-aminocyclopropane-1-carboxylate deaminase/D-cysteine desulfhydrase-like pyridoxal-dependent ACC family enzyme
MCGLRFLRLDKIHPIISGNKWFKLKYHIEIAKKENKDHIITFGGPYSNHIIATAAAGQLFGFSTTGIIRGERPQALSYTLDKAMEYGMKLLFTNREGYRSKQLPVEMSKEGISTSSMRVVTEKRVQRVQQRFWVIVKKKIFPTSFAPLELQPCSPG